MSANNEFKPDAGMQRIIAWGESQPLVRAIILTSTHAIPGAPVDAFSDYDPILILSDITPYFEQQDWLDHFGPLLIFYRDPLLEDDGITHSGYVVQYEDGSKIDFTLWPLAMLQQVMALSALPDELDAGYRVLLDKDGLTAALKPPTYQGYIPKPPTEREFLHEIEDLLLEATAAAKFLWRDDVMAAKHIMEYYMNQAHVRPMLEWHSEIARGWKLKPGPYGRGLKKHLRPDLWAMLEKTWTGAGLEENWTALFAILDLMRTAALEVAPHLGYAYPEALHQRTITYLMKVKNLDRAAKRLNF